MTVPFHLIEAIESGLFLLPEVAGGLSRVAISGIEGRLTPLTDLLIAALALEGEHQVFTLDDHFQRVPGLRLYEAPSK